jgi:Flp pilus assembly protein TadB
MDENALKQLWLDANKAERVEINPERFLETINQKLLNMDRRIKTRDRLEIFVALFMIALFGWWVIAAPQLFTKIGSGIIVGACLLVIYKLVSAKRVKIDPTISSATNYHLQVSLQRVRNQIRLLDTVFWWYLLPFFVGIMCLFYSYSITFTSKAFYTVTVAALYGYIYYLNKRTVRRHLKPLEDNIKNALDEFSSEE